MFKLKLDGQKFGKLFLAVLGVVSVLSLVFESDKYDQFNRRQNMKFSDVKGLEDFKQYIRDEFILKTPAQLFAGKLYNASIATPMKGAINYKGTLYYYAPLLEAPTTSYRGLFSINSKKNIEKNGNHFSVMARTLASCGVKVVYFLHPTKASAHKIFSHRGDYGLSDIQLFKKNADTTLGKIIDLTNETQQLSASSPLELYYKFGTHKNRYGAHEVAKVILNHLVNQGFVSKGKVIADVKTRLDTNKFHAVTDQRFGAHVDEGLFQMVHGKNPSINLQYPQLDESIFRDIEVGGDSWPLVLENANAFSTLSVTIVGDSFTTYLLPYFSMFFSKVSFHRDAAFDGISALKNGSDLLILNHVSRVLHYERPFKTGLEC